MATDYAKAKAKTENPTSTKSLSQTLAMWLSTILLIFLFALGLFFLSHQDQLNDRKLNIADKKVVAKKQVIAKENSKPKFEFYNILTTEKPKHQDEQEEQAVQPAVAETHKAPTQQQPQPQQTVQRNISTKPKENNDRPAVVDASPSVNKFYYLQVASFRSPEDAETLKAKLSLAGYSVSIRKSFVKEAYWFRVFVGPYSQRPDAEAAQVTLRRYRLDGLIRDLS